MGHCLCGATGYIKISSGAYSERIPGSGCGHEAEIARLKTELSAATDEATEYEMESAHKDEQIDQLLGGSTEGMTPTDVRVMRQANAHMADEIRRLQAERDALLSQASAAATWIAGEPTEIPDIPQAISVFQHTFHIAQAKRNREIELEQERDALRGEGENLHAKLREVMEERDALKEKVKFYEMHMECQLGVGDGTGSLFIHGDYESIKAAQAVILERDMLKTDLKACAKALQASIKRENHGFTATTVLARPTIQALLKES